MPHGRYRLVVLGVSWVGIGLVVALLLACAIPLATGGRSYVVKSGSMSPSIDTGDVVAVKQISPLAARVGDVVTFNDPKGRLLSHRVRWIHGAGTKVEFTTQGDANTGQEHWKVAADGRIGRVTYRVPKLGFAIARMQSPAGRIGLIIAPAVLLAVSLLIGLWRRPVPEEAGDAKAA